MRDNIRERGGGEARGAPRNDLTSELALGARVAHRNDASLLEPRLKMGRKGHELTRAKSARRNPDGRMEARSEKRD